MAKAKAKSDATHADVLSATGALIRTYSVDDHGEDFEKLANEFSAHTKDSTVVVR